MRDAVYVVSTGSELAGGRSRDSNGPEIAERLVELGFGVLGMRIVPDEPALLTEAIEQALSNPRVAAIIMTGGLGPTADDHTIDVLASISGQSITEDSAALRKMELLAKRWKRRFNLEAARRQARVLSDSEVLSNKHGLAPGVLLRLSRGESRCLLAAMPGVPQEMGVMFEQELLPHLQKEVPRHGRRRMSFYLYGMGESNFQMEFFGKLGQGERRAAALAPPESLPADFVWGVTAARGYIKVFLESRDSDRVEELVSLARTHFPLQFMDVPAPEALHEYFVGSNKTLGLAESCTGGWIGKMLTDRPGTSGYLLGSAVTYANSAKETLLGVPRAVLEEFGAVSEQCARAMAQGARQAFGADFAVAVTGIAGPDGGSAEKPVGTVYLGLADAGRTAVHRLDLPLDRDRVREYSANLAIFHLYRFATSGE